MSNETPTVAEQTDLEARLTKLLDETTESLEPIAPERALELYLDDKARDCQKSTLNSHRSRLGFFLEWCEEEAIESLDVLSARDLHEFKVWRREGLSVVTERSILATLRVFIQWCESIDAVETGLFRKIDLPDVDDKESASDTVLHASRAREILTHLKRYEYATIEHVCWLVLVETGMRVGSAHSLDVQDYHPDARTAHLEIHHRPETDTPLKNKTRGERKVAISQDACDILDNYLDQRRPDEPDDNGRDPLFATARGRVSKSTMRTYIYKWSRPCAIGTDCPHDRNPDDCEAVTNRGRHSRCPSSVTPHPIRRGYITQLLRKGVPVEVVGDRCNVTPAIIDQHYDVRSEEDKMKQRKEVLDEVQQGESSFI